MQCRLQRVREVLQKPSSDSEESLRDKHANDHTFDALLHGVQAVKKLDTANGGLFPRVMSYAWPWIAQSVDKAVLPILYAATAPHVIGGDPMHVLAHLHGGTDLSALLDAYRCNKKGDKVSGLVVSGLILDRACQTALFPWLQDKGSIMDRPCLEAQWKSSGQRMHVCGRPEERGWFLTWRVGPGHLTQYRR